METKQYRHSRNKRRVFSRNAAPRHSGGFHRDRSHGNRNTHNSQRGGGGRRKMPTFDPSRFINENPVDITEEAYTPTHKFSEFGLNGKLVRTVASSGMHMPSPIQDKVIPEILKGNDVIGLAETGTGKTAAFLLPLIEMTLKEYSRQTLVLTPTRELAIQIAAELKKLSEGFKIYSVTCVGGANIRPQIQSLRRQNHFIIGTPGRILDLMERRHFVPAKVTTVVLDEADRMLDMGFIQPMKDILSKTSPNRETLFFSATMDDRTKSLVHDFMRNPVMVSVKKRETTNNIKHQTGCRTTWKSQ
jgi:superfamily II DNA/RNA helicase